MLALPAGHTQKHSKTIWRASIFAIYHFHFSWQRDLNGKKSPNRCSPFPKLSSVAATRESDEWGPHTHPKSVAIFSKVCLAPWENMPHRCIITRFCLVEMQEQRERGSSSFLYQLFLAAFSLIFLLLQFRGSCKNNRRAEGKGGISSEQHFFQQSNLLCLSSLLLRFSQKRECIL